MQYIQRVVVLMIKTAHYKLYVSTRLKCNLGWSKFTKKKYDLKNENTLHEE